METPPGKRPKIPNSCEEEDLQKWRNLPKDVLIRIIRYLDLKIDLPRLRGVCPSWRSALSLAELPHLTSRFKVPSIEEEEEDQNPLILVESRFYLVSSLLSGFNGGRKWLARMVEIRPNRWYVLNPLNMNENLFTSRPHLTGFINLLEFLQISSVFSLIYASGENRNPISKKVVGGWNFSSSYIFAVLVQIEKEKGGGLLVWRLGDKDWTKIEGRVYDIAFHNGKFYVLDLDKKRIGVIDPANPSMVAMEFISVSEIIKKRANGLMVHDHLRKWGSLVPSNGGLYLVMLAGNDSHNKPNTMIVFFMKEDKKWERVASLGDQTFFISHDMSFSLPSSSKNLLGWKSNSIVLLLKPYQQSIDEYNKGCGGNMPKGLECLDYINYPKYFKYFRMFNMEEEDKGLVPFKELSMEVYTGLFFPPPPWIKWYCYCFCHTLGNGKIKLDGLKFRV